MVLVTIPPPHTLHNKMVSSSVIIVILSKQVSLFSMIHHYLFHIGLMLFQTTSYLINRQPTSLLQNRSPFDALFGQKPNYLKLRKFGCLCYPLTRPYNTHKMQQKSSLCVFIGYSQTQSDYKCLNLKTHKIYISRHVLFDEPNTPTLYYTKPKIQTPESHNAPLFPDA